MNQEITSALKDIEKKHSVKILYACESGSRAWGFASTDSDYDVRFIYMHQPDYYLSIFDDRRDVIELPIDDLLDISGWDLKKSLSLLYKNNLALFEWINSPIVYLNRDLDNTLKRLVNSYFKTDRAHYHYFSMAKGFYEDHLLNVAKPNMKKFFYCMRTTAACLWVKKFKNMPPVAFEGMLISEIMPNAVVKEIQKLILEKSDKTEGDTTANAKESLAFISKTLNDLADYKPDKNTFDKEFIESSFKNFLKMYEDL